MGRFVGVNMERLLSELSPNLTKLRLRFNCPACSKTHWIVIAIHSDGKSDDKDEVWSATGSLENLTISPSIDGTKDYVLNSGKRIKATCVFHGHVRNGIVSW